MQKYKQAIEITKKKKKKNVDTSKDSKENRNFVFLRIYNSTIFFIFSFYKINKSLYELFVYIHLLVSFNFIHSLPLIFECTVNCAIGFVAVGGDGGDGHGTDDKITDFYELQKYFRWCLDAADATEFGFLLNFFSVLMRMLYCCTL